MSSHSPETLPSYEYTGLGTLLFVTGSPLSGKSTITPQIAAAIDGSVSQNLDIMRILAQKQDELLPSSEQDPFLRYGSCDSYLAIGDGSYSPEKLLRGYNLYSKAVSRLVDQVIPSLEAQGAQSVIFEGVQLQPSVIEPYLHQNNKLVVITSSTARLRQNREKLFPSQETELHERYATNRLLLIQEELVSQADTLPKDSVLLVENNGTMHDAVNKILQFLQTSNVICQKPV